MNCVDPCLQLTRRFLPQTAKCFAVVWFLFSLAFAVDLKGGENWTSFQNGGQIRLSQEIPGSNFETLWTADLPGYGQSSPTSWDGQMYVTSVSGENKETLHISAISTKTGKTVWHHELPNSSPQESTNYVSKAAPTPVVDEAGLIAFFEGGNLIALTHSGEVRWQRDLVKEYGAIDSRHGLSSSPEQLGNTVFVWVERQSDPYLLAIDKNTGENLWKQPGLGVTSWASLRLVSVEGGKHLVLSGVGKIAGLDPETGKQLWLFEEITGNSTPTPLPAGEGKFLIGATVGRGDSDSGRAAKSNGLISVAKDENGEWAASYLWQSKRATSSFGSPIIADGFCYFVNRTGVMYCLDANTGKEAYAERVGGSIWATPISTPGQLILPLKDGKLVVGTSGAKFKTTAEIEIFPSVKEAGDGGQNPFGGATLYAGVLIDGKLILRSGDKVYCLQSSNSAE